MKAVRKYPFLLWRGKGRGGGGGGKWLEIEHGKERGERGEREGKERERVVHGLSQRGGLVVADELEDVVSRAKTILLKKKIRKKLKIKEHIFFLPKKKKKNLSNSNSVLLRGQTPSNQLQKMLIVTKTPVPLLLNLSRELRVNLAKRSSKDFLVGLGGSSFFGLLVGDGPDQTSRLSFALGGSFSVSVGSFSLSEHVHDHVRSTEGVQGQDDLKIK